jgi:hypothetical protein
MEVAPGTKQRPATLLNVLDPAAVTAAALYLLTGSACVTLIGTTAATFLTAWRMWLPVYAQRHGPQKCHGRAAVDSCPGCCWPLKNPP